MEPMGAGDLPGGRGVRAGARGRRGVVVPQQGRDGGRAMAEDGRDCRTPGTVGHSEGVLFLYTRRELFKRKAAGCSCLSSRMREELLRATPPHSKWRGCSMIVQGTWVGLKPSPPGGRRTRTITLAPHQTHIGHYDSSDIKAHARSTTSVRLSSRNRTRHPSPCP